MAYFYRLIFAVLLQMLAASFAYASFAIPSGEWYSADYRMTCQQLAQLKEGVISSVGGGGCTIERFANGEVTHRWIYPVQQLPAVCPAGSTNTGGSCACNAPSVENASHTACVAAPFTCTPPQVLDATGTACTTPLVCTGHTHKNAAGTACEPDTPQQICWSNAVLGSQYNQDREVILKGNQDTDHLCVTTDGLGPGTGCTAKMDFAIKYALPDGTYVTNGIIRFDVGEPVGPGGTTCALTSSEKPVSNKCVNGQPGKVNGVDVCIPFPPGTTATTKTSGSTTGNTPSGNPVDIKTDTVNTCTGASCNSVTTTTVTTNINGTVTTNSSSVTTSAPKSDFCTVHPRDNQCGQSGDGDSSFGGSCQSGFQCNGDGLQCAIAKEQHKRNCEMFVNKTDESALYDSAKAQDQTKSVVQETEVNISSSMFSSTNILGGGACIADKSVVIAGHSLTLPFSKVCPYLEYIGYLNLALAFLLAARIVSRG